MCPCVDLTCRLFVFFCLIFRQLRYFWENVDHLKPNTFSGKNKTKQKTEVRPRDRHVEHVFQNTGFISQKRRGQVDFWVQNEQDTLSPLIDLLGVSAGSFFFRQILLNVEHRKARPSILRVKKSADMPWITSNRFVHNAVQSAFSPALEKA